MPENRCVIYARVSSEEQSSVNQLPVLIEMSEKRGWEVKRIYTEEASAWRAGHQKELSNMLKSASYHEFDILLVWALDRLTRQGIGNIMNLVNTLKNYRVRVVSVQEPWTEQSGPMADLLYAITGWVAEFESKRRSERVKAGIEARRARGEYVGRKPGAKDIGKRKRMGYFERYNDRRK